MSNLQLGIGSLCVFILSGIVYSKIESWKGLSIGFVKFAISIIAIFSLGLIAISIFGAPKHDDCVTDYDAKGAYTDCR